MEKMWDLTLSLRSAKTSRFFPTHCPLILVSQASGLWAFWEGGSSRKKEGLYLDARSPNRLGGSEEAGGVVRRVQREKRKHIHSPPLLPSRADPGDTPPLHGMLIQGPESLKLPLEQSTSPAQQTSWRPGSTATERGCPCPRTI